MYACILMRYATVRARIDAGLPMNTQTMQFCSSKLGDDDGGDDDGDDDEGD